MALFNKWFWGKKTNIYLIIHSCMGMRFSPYLSHCTNINARLIINFNT